jgi:hypothetical protein
VFRSRTNTEKDRYAVVIMDRAAWHTTGKIKCFDNIIPMPFNFFPLFQQALPFSVRWAI